MNKLAAALEERLGLASGWRAFADQRVRGGVRVRHVFPAVMAYLFAQQALLGVMLATYYSPSSSDAWASTAYIQDQVTLGWFVRGMHYHGASAMIVVAGLWLMALAFFRGYRRPWEASWMAVLGIVGLSLALGLSGNPLPWDQEGFWGIQVELAIAEQTPGGEIIRTLIQGGSDAGNLTVLRLYVIHVFLLPGAFLLLLWLVFRQRRLRGTPPPDQMSEADADRLSQPYFPFQAFVDVLAMAVVGGALVGLTVATHGAELMAPADITENFQARPAWYFLFLYKLRMFFEGPMEPVATMVIPGAAAVFLLAVPFIDRIGGGLGKLVVRVGVGALMAGVILMTGVAIMADEADEEYQKSLVQAAKTSERARGFAREGVVPQGGPAVFWNDPQYQIKQLYKEHCQSCHSIDGVGGEEAPDLSDYGSRQWLIGAIRDVNDPRYLGNTEHKGEMDPYDTEALPDEQLEPLLEYLFQLQGDGAPFDQKLAAKGAELWEDELECNSCHEIEPGAEGDGPNMHQRGSKAWVMRVIRDSSKPDLYGDDAQMPKFEGKLSDEEIGQLADYVLATGRSDGQEEGEGGEGSASAEPTQE